MNKKLRFLSMMIIFSLYVSNANAQTPQVGPAQAICYSTQPTDITLTGTTVDIIKWQKATDSSFSDATDIANTNTTLTGAIIGNLTQTTWFRPVLDEEDSDVLPVKIEVGILTTWDGSNWDNAAPNSLNTAVFAGNYSSTSSIDACKVVVTNDAQVVINTDHTLIVKTNVVVSDGTLVFENKASLVQVGNEANSGTITYKRNTMLRRYDYTYWSSPVASLALNALSPLTAADKFYWWNATGIPNLGWTNASPSALMNPGQGYIIRGPQTYSTTDLAPWTGEFTGVPNNGDYAVNVYASDSNNFNLLGNPYPSAISADELMDENTDALGEFGTTLYFWTHNTPLTSNAYAYNDYATYNKTGGTRAAEGENNPIPTGMIGAGQGFMVKAIHTGVVTFSNQMRLTGNNQLFFRPNAKVTNSEKHRIWLDLKNEQGQFKEILLGYINHATNSYDDGFDGLVAEAGNVISFYSVNDTKKLSIQGRALPFTANDEVPIGYRTNSASTYTISLSNFDGLFAQQSVYLEDTLLNTIHDLKESPYSFITAAGTFDTRFVVRFSATALGVAHNLLTSDAISIYNEHQQMVIDAGNNIMSDITVFDATGRELFNKGSINMSIFKLNNLGAKGLLLIRIKTGDNQTIVKKYIQ